MSAPESWKTLGSIPARTTSSWLSSSTRTAGTSSTGLATCRPGVASKLGRNDSTSSGTLLRIALPPGRIEATQRSAPPRADSATVPSATTAASAIIIAPTVRPVRTRSRAQVRAPEKPLRAEDPLERTADDPAERLEDKGGRDRAADEEPEGQDEREERRAGAPDREEQDAGDHDDELGDDERAQPVAESHHGVRRGAQGGDR